jgi:hypothetical protein
MNDNVTGGIIAGGVITIFLIIVYKSSDSLNIGENIKNINRSGKKVGSSEDIVKNTVNSLSKSVSSLASDEFFNFRKSEASIYNSKSGGSRRRCKKGGKRKTKGRK